MFAFARTEKIEIKDDEGKTVEVTLVKLPHRVLREARLIAQRESSQNLKDMGGDIARALFKPNEEDAKKLEEAKKRVKAKPDYEAAKKLRYTTYDRVTILQHGIKSWTRPEDINDDSRDALDEETAQLFHEKILDLSLPPLDPKDYEAAQVKD